MKTTFENEAVRELDYRHDGGIEVALLWEPRTDALFVSVVDGSTSNRFRIGVDATDALDAFHHPFGYRRRRESGLDLTGATRAEPAR